MPQDYPPAIKALVPPKTQTEKRQTMIYGMPFLLVLLILLFVFVFRLAADSFPALFLYAFGVVWAFNIWGWLVLDWLIFCTITPKEFVTPSSEGHPAYKNYAFHFRGFLNGTVFSMALVLVTAAVAFLIK